MFRSGADMLFTMDKNKSLAILQAVMALFIVLTPSVMGILPGSVAIYTMFMLFAALTVIRIRATEKMYLSIYHIIFSVMLLYSVLSSIWADNAEGQLIYIFAIACVILLFAVVADYFSEGSLENIRRRMMYMLSISGLLCSVLNVFYWLIYIVPFAEKQSFSRGFGSNDYLALFMAICIAVTLMLLKGNTKLRKKLLILQTILMLFVFVMAKSTVAWIFALVLGALYISAVKSKKTFVVFSLLCAVVFTGLLALTVFGGTDGIIFKDVFSYAADNLFGVGGGFWSGKPLFASQIYQDNEKVGLLAYLFASSGVLGLVCCAAIIFRSVMIFCRLKTWESLVGIFLTVSVMLLPFNMNFAVILFWSGLTAYNEYAAGLLLKKNLRKVTFEKLLYAVLVLIVIAAMLVGQAMIRINADLKYKNKDYTSAAMLYKAAAAINIVDSESCRMAARSLRKGGYLEPGRDEAISLIDKAIKRDGGNFDNTVEKARIYYANGEYELSAQQYRVAAKKAVVKDEYNLSLTKVLYKIVEKYPQGSSETKRAYEEMLKIAAGTESLDTRKEINDIADKALRFTKGELSNEEG